MKQLRVNFEIRAPLVFLIDEEGKPLGRYALGEALRIAKERGYDLVEVGPGANPPVCKILDYGKYRYQEEKQLRKQRNAAKAGGIKEVRLSYKIEDHDFDVRVRAAKRFIEEGNKVKVSLILFGRQRMFADLATKAFDVFKERVGGVEYEGPIGKLGNRLIGILIPHRVKQENDKEEKEENRGHDAKAENK